MNDAHTSIAELRAAGQSLIDETAATARVKDEMEAVSADGPERTLLLAPLGVWSTMRGIVDEHVAELLELSDQLAAAVDDPAAYARLARRVEVKVEGIVSLTEVPRGLIQDWDDSTDQQLLADDAEALVAEVKRAVAAADASIEQLQASARAIADGRIVQRPGEA